MSIFPLTALLHALPRISHHLHYRRNIIIRDNHIFQTPNVQENLPSPSK